MNRIVLFCCCIFLTFQAFGQQQLLKITNPSLSKEILIKENKRIKIKTVDGIKHAGRFTAGVDQTLIIDGVPIALADIAEIKRNPLLLSLFTSGFFIYAGAITAGVGLLVAVFGQPAGALLTIPAAGMVFIGIKSPNFLRKFKRGGNWTFELVPVAD